MALRDSDAFTKALFPDPDPQRKSPKQPKILPKPTQGQILMKICKEEVDKEKSKDPRYKITFFSEPEPKPRPTARETKKDIKKKKKLLKNDIRKIEKKAGKKRGKKLEKFLIKCGAIKPKTKKPEPKEPPKPTAVPKRSRW